MIVNEENVSVKISMPLIDNIELQRIDTFYNDIVSEYTKAFVKEKEQVIVQRLMMNLQQENARLKDKLTEINKVIDGYMPNEHAMCKAFDEIEFIIKEN